MKRIIRLTERDLTRIVKRTINEMEDEDFMRDADRNWKDREEFDPRFDAPSPDYDEDEDFEEYDPRFDAPSPGEGPKGWADYDEDFEEDEDWEEEDTYYTDNFRTTRKRRKG